MSLPISVGGQPGAIIVACQFVAQGTESDEVAWHSRLGGLAQSLSLPEADLWAFVDSVRALAESRLLRVPRLLQRVADIIGNRARAVGPSRPLGKDS